MKISRLLLSLAIAAALQAVALGALGQPAAAPPPPPMPEKSPLPEKLEPLPEIPPPPGVAGDTELEPEITITRKEGETVEQARVNGRIAWVKVTPRYGKPYYLIPDSEGNLYIRRDSLDSGLKVPLWVLFEF